jgi:DNA polymerase-3 subunit delta
MSVHLVTGDDEALLRAAVNDLVRELVGDGDRSLMVDEFDGDDYEVRAVLDAAQTPPFLTERRVVVARGVGRFTADDVAPIVAFVSDPLDTTDLVLVGGEGRVAKRLSDAVKAAGTIRDTSPPSRPKDRASWVAEHVTASGLRLDGRALTGLAAWLGEDVGRLDGIVATLRSAYGTSTVLSGDDIAPFLGDAGGVPPWDFTDAIDAGDTTKALTLLGRMMHAGERHPLQIMAILHAHYGNVAKLDGIDARSDADVMAATGVKSSFPARKALDNFRRLGGPAVKRAFELLAEADLDLRGARELPPELVMEVLVARLSKLRR